MSKCDQPRSLTERCEVAARFAAESGLALPVLVDSMANALTERFGAWPFRLFMLQYDGDAAYAGGSSGSDCAIEPWVLEYKAEPTAGFSYDVGELEQRLVGLRSLAAEAGPC